MSNQDEKKIDNINELLAMAGENLNILEEEVDVSVQKQYFELLTVLSKETDSFQELCRQYIENVNDLFDDAIDEEIKRGMLVVLATIDDITIYRTIENFSKQDTPLRKWAVIAFQQSRMLIQSNLLDDPGVFISTGLGGQGLLLRYFCVFLNRIPRQLQEFQQNIVRNETETFIGSAQGVIEQIDFSEDYTTMLILLPLNSDLQELFTEIIDECNLYGNFLHENMIITNVKKLEDAEIKTMLRARNRPGQLPD